MIMGQGQIFNIIKRKKKLINKIIEITQGGTFLSRLLFLSKEVKLREIFIPLLHGQMIQGRYLIIWYYIIKESSI